jgi:hypothetical protein
MRAFLAVRRAVSSWRAMSATIRDVDTRKAPRPLWQTDGVPMHRQGGVFPPGTQFVLCRCDVCRPAAEPERTAEALWTGDDWALAAGRDQ